jgi:hypothetical protein
MILCNSCLFRGGSQTSRVVFRFKRVGSGQFDHLKEIGSIRVWSGQFICWLFLFFDWFQLDCRLFNLELGQIESIWFLKKIKLDRVQIQTDLIDFSDRIGLYVCCTALLSYNLACHLLLLLLQKRIILGYKIH